jgi:hemolysin activation/secretion protein
MFKTSLTAIAFLAISQSAVAQVPVGAAGQMQQIPPAPKADQAAPEVRIEKAAPVVRADTGGARISVVALHVTGATVFSETDLIAATGFKPGAELDLNDLRDLAGRIAAHYNTHGYFLAQAYLPAQDVQNGVVTIAVAEGRYGAISLRNDARLSSGVIRGVLGGLDSGDLIASAPLERRLMLLSDLPGVEVKSTLSPGAAIGTSDLIIDLTPGRRITGSLEADNAGNRYTGAYRAGALIDFNNPTGRGDLASLRVLTSTSGLGYARAAYQAPIGVATVGVAYTHIHYELGKEFKSLGANGESDVASLFASYPLIRSRNTNLNAVANLDARRFVDRVDLFDARTRRDALALTLGLDGDHRDAFGGGGWTSYSVAWTTGDLDIKTPASLAVDRATARTNGGYNKLSASVARLQTVSGPLSLYGAVRGQIASKNLDTSEKMELGGAYAVRAYPEGEAYGDQGYVATAEARLMLPKPGSLPGRIQLVGFVDVGSVSLAKDPWFVGRNHADRSGYGVGLTWVSNDDFVIRVSHARKLGDDDATSAPDRSGRTWVQLSKLF